jgi:HSP20 family molecular chaperone IbpA
MKFTRNPAHKNQTAKRTTATPLPVQHSDSIPDEIEEMRDRIRSRAYEIYQSKAEGCGHELDNWLEAERELIRKPPVELIEGDSALKVLMAVADVDSEEIGIAVSPEYLLVKTGKPNGQGETNGKAQESRFEAGGIFQLVSFSKPVDPKKAKAEFKDGVLHFTAVVSEVEARAASF